MDSIELDYSNQARLVSKKIDLDWTSQAQLGPFKLDWILDIYLPCQQKKSSKKIKKIKKEKAGGYFPKVVFGESY